MRDSERKRLERAVYNREANTDRAAYHTLWDKDLYRALHAYAYDRQIETYGQRYLSGRKVLVLGAGRGEVGLALEYTKDVHALNISDRVVAELRTRFPEVNSFRGDAEQLDLGETYDVVLCKSILHHLHPIEGVLGEIRRVLQPDGHLVIAAEPGLLNPLAAAARVVSPSQEHTPGERPFILSQFRKQLQVHFEVEEEHTFFIVSMLIPYLAKKVPGAKAVLTKLLAPTLKLEAAAGRLPWVADLTWVLAGVYRACP